MAGPVNFKHSCILCKTLEVFWLVTLIKNYYYYYYKPLLKNTTIEHSERLVTLETGPRDLWPET